MKRTTSLIQAISWLVVAVAILVVSVSIFVAVL
jgi:uncharacterized membrane protein YidH (DUF202 family)